MFADAWCAVPSSNRTEANRVDKGVEPPDARTWGRCSKAPTQQRLVVTEGGNTGPLLASAGQPTTRVSAGRNDG
jgi:hypothetical protein